MYPLTVGAVIANPALNETVLALLKGLGVPVVAADLEAGLAAFGPDLLLVEVTADPERFPDLLRRVALLPGAPPVIALAESGNPELILSAMRSGASDCLLAPIDEGALRDALDRAAVQRSREELRRSTSKVAGFLSATGGCGATTLACHVAAELGRAGIGEVLLADFDLVAGVAGFWIKSNGAYSILDAARRVDRLDRSLWKGLVSAVQPHLDVIAAPPEPLTTGMPQPECLRAVLQFARANYDWVVADLGHSLTPVSAQLLPEVTALYLVTTPEIPALYLARRSIRKLTELGFGREWLAIVLNRVHEESALDPQELEKLLAVPIAAVLPEERAEVHDAQEEGRLVPPNSAPGKRIAELARKITGQPKQDKSRSKFSLFRAFRPQES